MNQTVGLGGQACAVAVVLHSSGDELYHHSATGNREQPSEAEDASILMMNEDEAMQLDWGDDDDDDDDDNDSWGLMDQADQEAIQLEELQVQQSCEDETDDGGGEGTETTSSSESQDEQQEDGESPHHRALSPVEQHHFLDYSQHRFIITPERQTASSPYFEVVSTEAAVNDDDDTREEQQEQPPGSSFAFARLAILMRRSDASRRTVVRYQCPTDYFGSSGFFHMEMERQQLRRMMNDC